VADSSIGFHFEASCSAAWPTHVADPAEQALVHDLSEGCEAAYEILIDRFERPIYSLVARLLSDDKGDDPGDAADIVQEVFLKVFRNIGSFRNDCSLKTWVYRIAVNEARNHRRWFSRHRRQEVVMEAAEHDEYGHDLATAPSPAQFIADPGPSPLQVALDHETAEMVEAALAAVNPSFRAALVLREVEGFSYEEIAQILEISLGTVKSRIVRGREDLRERLTRKANAAAPELKAWQSKDLQRKDLQRIKRNAPHSPAQGEAAR